MKNVVTLHRCTFIRRILIMLAIIIMTNIFMGDRGIADNTSLPIQPIVAVESIVLPEPIVIPQQEIACEIKIDKNKIASNGKMQFVDEIKDLKTEIADMRDGISYPDLFKVFFPKENYKKTVLVLAKVIHGEASGVKSTTNRACVVWCILNRVDQKHRGNNPRKCATASDQFAYVKSAKPRKDEIEIATDVLNRWLLEKIGGSEEEVGRVLPKKIVYFSGNGDYNEFRYAYPIGSKKYSKNKCLHSDVYGD